MKNMTFLRRVLVADAAISGTTGLLILLAANPLSKMLGVPAELLRYSGASLIPFTALLAYVITRDNLARTTVQTVIALNAVWVVASIALLFSDQIAPNRLGTAFIIVQAVMVALFAEMQYVGLRKVGVNAV